MTTTRISAADTHDLRRRILRAADPDAAVEWVGDDEDGTFHLGIRDESGAVVAISTWLHRPDPADPAAQATQLRGMATDPALAGRGLGSQLLLAGVERCRARGDDTVWAKSRVSALGFYERAGFTIVGAVFETADTGLPHRMVSRSLG